MKKLSLLNILNEELPKRRQNIPAQNQTAITKDYGDVQNYQKSGQTWQPGNDPSQGVDALIKARDRFGLTDEEMNYFLAPQWAGIQKEMYNGTLVVPAQVYQSLERKIEGGTQRGQIEDFLRFIQSVAPNYVDTSIKMIQPDEETNWPTQQSQSNAFAQFEPPE